jgi:hypothetical protein
VNSQFSDDSVVVVYKNSTLIAKGYTNKTTSSFNSHQQNYIGNTFSFNGYLSKIGLYFKEKGNTPITIGIKSFKDGVVGDFITSATMDSSRISTSEKGLAETLFEFQHPVQLNGVYALIIMSKSDEYKLFIGSNFDDTLNISGNVEVDAIVNFSNVGSLLIPSLDRQSKLSMKMYSAIFENDSMVLSFPKTMLKCLLSPIANTKNIDVNLQKHNLNVGDAGNITIESRVYTYDVISVASATKFTININQIQKSSAKIIGFIESPFIMSTFKSSFDKLKYINSNHPQNAINTNVNPCNITVDSPMIKKSDYISFYQKEFDLTDVLFKVQTNPIELSTPFKQVKFNFNAEISGNNVSVYYMVDYNLSIWNNAQYRQTDINEYSSTIDFNAPITKITFKIEMAGNNVNARLNNLKIIMFN